MASQCYKYKKANMSFGDDDDKIIEEEADGDGSDYDDRDLHDIPIGESINDSKYRIGTSNFS